MTTTSTPITHTGHIALGTMYFGTSVDRDTAFMLLDRFVELGGRWLDTADNYAFWRDPSGLGGQSERLIGAWLAARPGMRDHVWLSTKLGADPLEPNGWPDSMEGLSQEAIRRAITGSLARLGTEHVELLWAHVEDRVTPLNEQVDALGALVADGVVGELGASNHATWRVERARARARLTHTAGYQALQLRHTLLQPVPFAPLPDGGHVVATPEALDYAAEHGLPVWAYSSLLGGAYGRDDRKLQEPYEHPVTARTLRAVDEVAARHDATRNQVVLAWLLGGTPAVTPIVGVSSVAQLDEILDARHLQLTDADRARLAA